MSSPNILKATHLTNDRLKGVKGLDTFLVVLCVFCFAILRCSNDYIAIHKAIINENVLPVNV